VDHPLASEFEAEIVDLVREYKGEGEYLSVHHPDRADANDDYSDGTALSLLAGASGGIGSILVGEGLPTFIGCIRRGKMGEG
jgi:hypothetical protein